VRCATTPGTRSSPRRGVGRARARRSSSPAQGWGLGPLPAPPRDGDGALATLPNRTQPRLDVAQVGALARAALGSGARVAEAAPLRGGTFNACWAVTLAEGRRLVLKVAPPPDRPLLGYERDLLRAEVDFYARAAAVGVPVPEVVGVDFTRRAIASDYFLMTHVAGVPLDRVRRRLSPEDRARLRRALGAAAARIGTVRGERFGYAAPAVGTQSDTWRTSFTAIVGTLLRDAERLRVRLPRQVARLVEACAPALDAVTEPRLVHFDLWDGNVLVDPSGAPPRLAALIDGERAFFGDPLAELASLALFGDPTTDADLLRGFADVLGAPLALDPPARQRIALAQLYLYAIMRVEPATRGGGGLVGLVVQRLAARSLRRALRTLDALTA
jgi:aminoglycoside phosphotransferase (APT) family kinase protein